MGGFPWPGLEEVVITSGDILSAGTQQWPHTSARGPRVYSLAACTGGRENDEQLTTLLQADSGEISSEYANEVCSVGKRSFPADRI